MAIVSRDVPACPLCGSEAVLLKTDDNRYFIYCLNSLHCGLGTDFCSSPEGALQSWEGQKEYAHDVINERRNHG